jgi:hypothetical protein
MAEQEITWAFDVHCLYTPSTPVDNEGLCTICNKEPTSVFKDTCGITLSLCKDCATYFDELINGV